MGSSPRCTKALKFQPPAALTAEHSDRSAEPLETPHLKESAPTTKQQQPMYTGT